MILNILALRFILVNFNIAVFKKLVIVILFSGAALTVISVSAGPFASFYDEYEQTKLFGINLWSHVGFGRYMGFVFIVSLINIIYLGFLKKFLLDKIFFLLSFSGLLLSGLRSAIICSVLISGIIIIFSLKEKNVSLVRIFLFLTGGIAILVVAAYFNNSFAILSERFTQIFNVFHQENLSDGAISTRLHIYKNSFELFLQNKIWGRGLGGYYDDSLFEFTRGLKYPHNILIEYAIELGSAGLLFIVAVLIFIYKEVLKVNIILTFVFLYFILLAMFSYSIPFQTGMFSFMAFIFLSKVNIANLKALLSDVK